MPTLLSADEITAPSPVRVDYPEVVATARAKFQAGLSLRLVLGVGHGAGFVAPVQREGAIRGEMGIDIGGIDMENRPVARLGPPGGVWPRRP